MTTFYHYQPSGDYVYDGPDNEYETQTTNGASIKHLLELGHLSDDTTWYVYFLIRWGVKKMLCRGRVSTSSWVSMSSQSRSRSCRISIADCASMAMFKILCCREKKQDQWLNFILPHHKLPHSIPDMQTRDSMSLWTQRNPSVPWVTLVCRLSCQNIVLQRQPKGTYTLPCLQDQVSSHCSHVLPSFINSPTQSMATMWSKCFDELIVLLQPIMSILQLSWSDCLCQHSKSMACSFYYNTRICWHNTRSSTLLSQ